ncbi:MAG: hypothetical protein J0L88_03300 [Xanthomonadales bacterium]|nr:hypothetical protein [Xanthomonadales bacterium]
MKVIAVLAMTSPLPCFAVNHDQGEAFGHTIDRPNPKLALPGRVKAILPLADGSAILGGEFAAVNGELRPGLAKRKVDGSLDPNWRPQLKGQVNALAIDTQGRIYAAGLSGHVSESAYSVVRLHPDGSVDDSWSLPHIFPVLTLAVGGPFLYVGGELQPSSGGLQFLVRSALDGDGAVDETWTPQPNGLVRTLSFGEDASLFAGGEFTTIGGSPRGRIAKISTQDGHADPSWIVSVDAAIESVVAVAGGGAVIAGWFESVNGLPRPAIAKIDASGSVDSDWNVDLGVDAVLSVVSSADSTIDGAAYRYGSGPNGFAFRLDSKGHELWPRREFSESIRLAVSCVSGDRLVGGAFRQVAGQMRLGFAALDADGSLLPALDAELPGLARAVAVQPDGSVIIGGEFEKAGNLARRNLVRMRADGSVDGDWNPGANGVVRRLAVDGNDLAYVAGSFTSVGGLQKRGLARISTIGSGAVDPAWGGVLGTLLDMNVDAEGRVYLAGDMSYVNGLPVPTVVRFSRLGQLDTDWNPPIATVAWSISAVIDDAVYVGYAAGGLPIQPEGEVQKISVSDGASMAPPLVTDRPPGGIVVSPDGVYVFGIFTEIAGHPRYGVARLTVNGAVDPNWVTPFQGQVSGLVVGNDGRVYLSGGMHFGEDSVVRLASFSRDDGSHLADWDPQADWLVNGLERGPAGQLYAFGEFDRLDDEPRFGFAAIVADEAIFTHGFEQN